MNDLNCTMPGHEKRNVRAAIKLQVKSTRAGSPGHPMAREVLACAQHAGQLNAMGIEVITGK